MKKTIVLLALVAAGYASTTRSSYAANWDYSYTFTDGLVVSGSFVGTQVGDTVSGYVDNISDFTLDFNGVPVAAPVSIGTYEDSAFVNGGGVMSFDVTQNNFILFDTSSETTYLYLLPAGVFGEPYAYAQDTALGLSGGDYPDTAGVWTLVDPPSVPDGGSTAMLCGMGLMALGWMRRKLA